MTPEIEATIRRCTEPLNADWSVAREVAGELRLHFEDKCAELARSGLTPEQSAQVALRCFGAPEEVAADLFRANFRKLRRAVRLKWALRLLAVPAVLALLALLPATVNFDVAGGLNRLSEFVRSTVRLPGFVSGLAERYCAPNVDSEEELWLCAEAPTEAERTAMRRKLAERYPGNPVYLANYLLQSPAPSLDAPWYEPGLSRDPGNALYHYGRAAGRLTAAVPAVAAGNFRRELLDGERPRVKDREQLEQALSAYRSALRCPRNTDYAKERTAATNRLRHGGSGFAAAVGRKLTAARIRLPQLQGYGQLALLIPFGAGVLNREGRTGEAEKLLDTWPVFIGHLLQDCDTAIEVMVISRLLDDLRRLLPPAYSEIGRTEKGEAAARRITALAEPVRRWREVRKTQTETARNDYREQLIRYGGLFAVQQEWNSPEPVGGETLAAARRLTYTLYDQLLLMAFGVLGTAVIALSGTAWLAARLRHRGRWFRLTPRQYIRLLLVGVLLPLALYWLWIHCNPLNGRDVSVFRNPGYWLQCILLLLVLPGWFLICFSRELLRRSRILLPASGSGHRPALTFSDWMTNLIPLWIAFFLVTGGLLRLGLDNELRRNLAEETCFFSGDFLPGAEDGWSRRMTEAMREKLAAESENETPPQAGSDS